MGFEQLAALQAQLNRGESSKTVASRSTSSQVNVKREIKQPPKPPRTSANAAARAVTTLEALIGVLYPTALLGWLVSNVTRGAPPRA